MYKELFQGGCGQEAVQGNVGLELVFSGPWQCTDILEKTELAATLAQSHVEEEIIVYV